jgi:Flp pilus assembly protein TadG
MISQVLQKLKVASVRANSGQQKGASAIEFALVAPVFLFITFALIEYAVIFGALYCLNSATAEAARRTTVFQAGFNEANYKSFADTALSSSLPDYIGTFKSHVTLATSLEDCGTERCIRFKATYGDYSANPLIFHFPDFILPGSLVSESVARIEVDPFSN